MGYLLMTTNILKFMALQRTSPDVPTPEIRADFWCFFGVQWAKDLKFQTRKTFQKNM